MESIYMNVAWDDLPLEERKRRIAVRKSNAGKYKESLIVNDPNLLGMS